MTEAAPRRGAGLQGAARAVQAAQGSEPATSHRLTWDDLQAWPDWALPGRGDADTLVWRLAALWHADALRRCIDGPSLQLAARLVGAAALQALLEAPPPLPAAGGAAALPAAPELETAWRRIGRSLALASIERPELRHAVTLNLRHGRGWTDADPAACDDAPCAALLAAALLLPAADGPEAAR